jgi:hypothetical protein
MTNGDAMKRVRLSLVGLLLLTLLPNIYTYPFDQLLPLPTSFSTMPVYYHKVQQLNNWSCGYNVLYNACKIEERYGHLNENATPSLFMKNCSVELRRRGIHDTRAALRTDIAESLASQLGLENFHTLLIKYNKVTPLISSVEYCPAQQTAEQAYLERCCTLIESLKEKINKPVDDKPIFIHFLCCVQSENVPHGTLISLVKKTDGEIAIHIADSLNDPIHENSEMQHMISSVCKEFDIKPTSYNSQNLAHIDPSIYQSTTSNSDCTANKIGCNNSIQPNLKRDLYPTSPATSDSYCKINNTKNIYKQPKRKKKQSKNKNRRYRALLAKLRKAAKGLQRRQLSKRARYTYIKRALSVAQNYKNKK